MSGTNDIEHVKIKLFDQVVQVRIDEDQPGTCSPVA